MFTAHTNGRNYHLSSVHSTTTDYKENCPEKEIKASANINTNLKNPYRTAEKIHSVTNLIENKIIRL